MKITPGHEGIPPRNIDASKESKNTESILISRLKKTLQTILILIIMMSLFVSPSLPTVTGQDGEGENGEESTRYKIVDRDVTITTWQMVSLINNEIVCQFPIDYAGYPSNQDIFLFCSEELSQDKFSGLVSDGGLVQNVYWIMISQETTVQTEKIPLMNMYLDINAPDIMVEEPYVILEAVEPLSDYEITGIFGEVNGKPFECYGDVCKLFIPYDAYIVYWATSSFGDTSRNYYASIRILEFPPYFKTQIEAKSSYYLRGDEGYLDVLEDVALDEVPSWMYMPVNASQLHTYTELQYLAAKLILYGMVDLSNCPGGGLITYTIPDACGLEAAMPEVYKWQNQFDSVLFDAAMQTGVPPRFLKALFIQETQFWPQSSYHALEEFGLGQLSFLGADTALRWNNVLTHRICENLNADCDVFYAAMEPEKQAYLRGGLVQLVNADCPTCDMGIDLIKTNASIPVFANIVLANVRQTAYILSRHETSALYDDLWRFTLVSYHAGYDILDEAIGDARNYYLDATWDNISRFIDHPTAVEYVEKVWAIMNPPEEVSEMPTPTPEIKSTPVLAITPIPTPRPLTGNRVSGIIEVSVYIDRNENGEMDKGEEVSDLIAVAEFATGDSEILEVKNGKVTFEYTNQWVNSSVVISLPLVYRSTVINIPESGYSEAGFILEEPELPVIMP